jgi:RNA polymerase sigma factor (sigma-70 family)
MAQDRPSPDWHSLVEQMLVRILCGDDEKTARAAFNELWHRHEKELRDQANRQCGGNEDLSNEAMQRLYIRLWEKRKKYNPDIGRWITWAKTVLRNIVIDLFRDGARLPGAPLPVPPGPPPDRQLKLQELHQAMSDCLQRLPLKERTALILQVLEGLSLEEIGKQTGVPWETAGTRIYRAKLKMRECLKRNGYEGGEI